MFAIKLLSYRLTDYNKTQLMSILYGYNTLGLFLRPELVNQY